MVLTFKILDLLFFFLLLVFSTKSPILFFKKEKKRTWIRFFLEIETNPIRFFFVDIFVFVTNCDSYLGLDLFRTDLSD